MVDWTSEIDWARLGPFVSGLGMFVFDLGTCKVIEFNKRIRLVDWDGGLGLGL